MLMILVWIVKKVNVGKSFESSISDIESGIKNSDEAKQTSMAQFKDAKLLLDNLPAEIKEIEGNTASKLEIFKNQIKEDTKKTIEGLSVNADKFIEVEEKKLSNLITEQTSEKSIELAKLQILEMLKKNPQLHNQFIQDSIEELEKVNL
jgi:F0F1-type ATP synthase membrane subunit b/b'